MQFKIKKMTHKLSVIIDEYIAGFPHHIQVQLQ